MLLLHRGVELGIVEVEEKGFCKLEEEEGEEGGWIENEQLIEKEDAIDD